MRSVRVWLLFAALMVLAPTPANAAWTEAKSRHFKIYADLDPTNLQRLAERLERFDQAVRELRGMDDPTLSDSERLTVFALDGEEDVSRLIGSDNVLGFYQSGVAGSYAFVPRKPGFIAQRIQMSPETVFFHEYSHHLQLGNTSVVLPAWASEGFAEFFATAEIEPNGDVQIGKPPIYRQWSVQRYDGLSIDELLSASLRNATDEQIENLYGRGWLLTHMLTFSPERQGQLQLYLEGIQKGVSPLDAAKRAFGQDLGSLDRDMDRYLRQPTFKTLVVDGSKLSTGPVTIRPLRQGEAAIMEVQMELRSGVDKKRAERLAAEARKVVATYPTEPETQLALAEAELKARDFPAAQAAAKAALALDPNLPSAAIILGQSKMEAGREASASTDWNEVRSWFLQANRIDPENARPLMLFYRSFLYGNEQPTANAVNGLLYAVVLAPRDGDLRVDATRQLVLDNRLEEARKMFEPLAYYPHSDLEWRATKTAIMDALTQSDRSAALALLDAEQKKRWAKETNSPH